MDNKSGTQNFEVAPNFLRFCAPLIYLIAEIMTSEAHPVLPTVVFPLHPSQGRCIPTSPKRLSIATAIPAFYLPITVKVKTGFMTEGYYTNARAGGNVTI
jgi:hypothetical protein